MGNIEWRWVSSFDMRSNNTGTSMNRQPTSCTRIYRTLIKSTWYLSQIFVKGIHPKYTLATRQESFKDNAVHFTVPSQHLLPHHHLSTPPLPLPQPNPRIPPTLSAHGL